MIQDELQSGLILSIATREILTGPGVVDKVTIKATLAGAKQGTR